jgi:aryl-alcohol dehydrogenase-like predicted oxidoreductase
VQRRRLGGNGPEVSVVGLGANNFGWRIGVDETRAVVDAAIEEGVTLFDTSDVYGETRSERFLGDVLSGRRDRVELITKFGVAVPNSPELPRGSRDYIRWAIDRSLGRLRTDFVDVYMYHYPDGVTPMAETIGALGELVREGKARSVGVSNVDTGQIEEAAAAARADGVPLVCVENRYSLIRRDAEDDVVPVCERLGLSLLPYYPLEGGLLTGKYQRGEPPPEHSRFAANATWPIGAGPPSEPTPTGQGARPIWPRERWLTDEAFNRVEALECYAAERGVSLLGVAIGGLAAMPAVGSVIAGATTPDQVRANARAGAWRPSSGDLAELRALR